MIEFSPAKINIGLHVLRKRKDDFHDIESLFYPIAWHDVVEIIPTDNKNKLTSFGRKIDASAEDNLCMKAAELLQKKYDLPYLHIILQKNIPLGAGLGGGSSNAVAVIKAINKLFNLQCTDNLLVEYALLLGSDTAFFVKNEPTLVSGRGEQLIPVSFSLSNYYIGIIYPELHSNTAEAYKNILPQERQITMADLIKLPIEQWQENIKNDFESYVFLKYPVVKKIKQQLLESGAVYASMSGSGSSVFGIFKEKLQNIGNYQVKWIKE